LILGNVFFLAEIFLSAGIAMVLPNFITYVPVAPVPIQNLNTKCSYAFLYISTIKLLLLLFEIIGQKGG